MVKRLLSVALIVLVCTAQTPTPNRSPLKAASHFEVHLTVRNQSSTCSWVTIYAAQSPFYSWRIVHSGYVDKNRSVEIGLGFLDRGHLGEKYGDGEVKVLSEWEPDCKPGSKIAAHAAWNQDLRPRGSSSMKITSILSGPPYSVSRPQ